MRQEDLKLAGVELTRVTGQRLDREPERVIERVARLLENAARGAGSSGLRPLSRSDSSR